MDDINVPKVSICCMAYNHEPYIRDTLEGFVMQKTDFPYEVIITDDASTDKTAEIIKEYEIKYPDIIKPIYHKENQHAKGIGNLKNHIFPRVKGKYVAFCEGDDFWCDELKLQKQYDAMEGDDKASICATNYFIFDQNWRRLIKYNRKNIIIPEDRREAAKIVLLGQCGFHFCTTFIRSECLFDSLDEWTRDKKNAPMGDIQLYFHMLKRGTSIYLPDHTAVYRKHGTSVSHYKDKKKHKEFMDRARQSLINIANNNDMPELIPILMEKISKAGKSLGIYEKIKKAISFPLARMRYNRLKEMPFKKKVEYLSTL